MRILWPYLILLAVVQTSSQLISQMKFSQSGNVLPYIEYFDVYLIVLIKVYQSQTLKVIFSTKCPNLKIIFVNSMGSIISNFSAAPYNSGNNYYYTFGIGAGNRQGISLVDWNGIKYCNWSFSFSLNFSCGVVTNNCYDCSSYTTCTFCNYGYFLYTNLCYLNLPNCLQRFGPTCIKCYSGYALNNGNCFECSSFMPGCLTCTSTTICTKCSNQYTFASGNVGCAICSSFMPNCTSCINSTYCTSCPLGYALANSIKCQLCNDILSGCLQCSSPSVCTKCAAGFAVTSNSTCQQCSTLISNCTSCSSSSNCQKCSPGFSLSPTSCTQCTFIMNGCQTCNATDCLSCYDGYWYDSIAAICNPCNDQLSNCDACSNSTWCTSCSSGYGFLPITNTTISNTTTFTRNCSTCSIIFQCATCSNIQTCTSCVTNYYLYQYNNQCYSCNWYMSNCLSCKDMNTCLACINTGFALYENNRCYACSNWMSNCLNCSDYFTCTNCAAGFMLVYSRCKPCYILLSHCHTCSNQTVCTSCQVTYYLDTVSGNCQPCSFFLPNCTLCSNKTVCTQCLPGTIIQAGQCKTCDEVFPNCIGCVTNASCALCDQGFVPYLGKCQPCKTFISHCSNCFDTNHCQQCFDPYLADSNKKCKCKSSLYNVSDFCLADKNCVSAYKRNDQIYCGFCNIGALFQLDVNYQCVCKTGYKQVNDQCVAVCGDGVLINEECDDNNTRDNDGCSSKCTIQTDFVCNQLPTGVSSCRLIKNVELKYDYTFKSLNQNKGYMYISLSSNYPAIINYYLSPLFKFKIMHNRSSSLNITSFQMNAKGQLIVDIEYNETIQDSSINLKFIFNESFIISEPNFLKFQMKGTNYPLVISELNQNYQFNYSITKYFMLIAYALALLLLFLDKFIAVEGINTIQLTFFSLLLIYNNADWPMAMMALIPLKFSTGFNQLIFQPNPYDNINNAFNKFQYVGTHFSYFLGISNYFIENNLINSVILLIAFFITVILFSIKTKRENVLLEIKDGSQKKKLLIQLEKLRKLFRKVYNATFHFSYTMILQVVLSLYVEFSFQKTISPLMMIANKFISMLTLTILFVTILENYKHFFLSTKDTYAQNFQVGSQEARYRKVYFVYIALNTVCMFFLNNKKLFTFVVSFYVLIMAAIYLLFLLIYRPYKHSFSIHGFTVCFNQLMLIFALLMVNIINFNIQLGEVFFLIFNYIIMGFSVTVMLLIAVRVFFDWKYGDEQVLKKIKLELQMNKKQENLLLLNKATKLQEKNKKHQQNPYLYENQKLQVQKVNFLNQLKSKTFLTEWEKDHSYFNVYDKKPIGWVYQNQTQEKYKFLLQKEKQRFENDVEKQQMLKTKNEKLLDNNYIDELQKVKEKLRNQYAARQSKKKQKRQEERIKKKVQKEAKQKQQIKDKM